MRDRASSRKNATENTINSVRVSDKSARDINRFRQLELKPTLAMFRLALLLLSLYMWHIRCLLSTEVTLPFQNDRVSFLCRASLVSLQKGIKNKPVRPKMSPLANCALVKLPLMVAEGKNGSVESCSDKEKRSSREKGGGAKRPAKDPETRSVGSVSLLCRSELSETRSKVLQTQVCACFWTQETTQALQSFLQSEITLCLVIIPQVLLCSSVRQTVKYVASDRGQSSGTEMDIIFAFGNATVTVAGNPVPQWTLQAHQGQIEGARGLQKSLAKSNWTERNADNSVLQRTVTNLGHLNGHKESKENQSFETEVNFNKSLQTQIVNFSKLQKLILLIKGEKEVFVGMVPPQMVEWLTSSRRDFF